MELTNILEKLYFHELEIREKIIARIQFAFTLNASFVGLIASMCKAVEYSDNLKPIVIFYLIILITICFLGISVYYAYKALTGYTYLEMPEGNNIIEYQKKLQDYKENIEVYNIENKDHKTDVPQIEIKIESFLNNKFAKCATHNKKKNEIRRKLISQSFKKLWISVIFLIVGGSYFIFMRLDHHQDKVSLDNKVYIELGLDSGFKAIINKITQTRSSIMSDNNNEKRNQYTPPPPPPPKEPDVVPSTEDLKIDTTKEIQILNEDE